MLQTCSFTLSIADENCRELVSISEDTLARSFCLAHFEILSSNLFSLLDTFLSDVFKSIASEMNGSNQIVLTDLKNGLTFEGIVIRLFWWQWHHRSFCGCGWKPIFSSLTEDFRVSQLKDGLLQIVDLALDFLHLLDNHSKPAMSTNDCCGSQL